MLLSTYFGPGTVPRAILIYLIPIASTVRLVIVPIQHGEETEAQRVV